MKTLHHLGLAVIGLVLFHTSITAMAYTNLAGTWYVNGNSNSPAYITQHGYNQLTFKMGKHYSKGYFTSTQTVKATNWNAKGTIRYQGQQIRWNNQTWYRKPISRNPSGNRWTTGSGILTSTRAYDYVSASDAFRKDGRADAQFRLNVNSSHYRRIVHIELRNTNGWYSVWDTRPGNSPWATAVFKNSRLMNGAGGVVSFTISPGQTTLYLHVQDNGSIRAGKTRYKATITYADGGKQVIPIGRGTTTDNGGHGGNTGTVSGTGTLVSTQAYDYVSASNAFKRDNRVDAQFKLTINSTAYKRINNIELRNTNGQYSVWDTNPKTGHWAMAVFRGSQLMNGAGGTVSFTINPGYNYIYLHVQDNGSIRNRRTGFKAIITFSDGSKREVYIR